MFRFRWTHPTATAKDEDSVQCLDCSLIEDNQPPEMDTASSASTTKYDFLSCWESWIMYKIFSGSLVQRFGIINKFSVCLWKPQASTTLILEIDVQLKRNSMVQESEIIAIESGDGIAFYKVRPGECEFS